MLPNTEHIRIVGLKDVPCLGTGRRSDPAAAVAAAGSDCSIGVVSATGSEKRRGRFCSHGRPAAEAAVSPTTTTTTTRPKKNEDTTQRRPAGRIGLIPFLVGVETKDDNNSMTLDLLGENGTICRQDVRSNPTSGS